MRKQTPAAVHTARSTQDLSIWHLMVTVLEWLVVLVAVKPFTAEHGVGI